MDRFKPSSKIVILTVPMLCFFCGSFVLFTICLVFVMLLPLFITALWSPTGKGLTSWLSFEMLNCVSVTFQCGILGQVWLLIVSITDLYHLFYFYRESPAYFEDQINGLDCELLIDPYPSGGILYTIIF